LRRSQRTITLYIVQITQPRLENRPLLAVLARLWMW
jgi:hypothetical protein